MLCPRRAPGRPMPSASSSAASSPATTSWTWSSPAAVLRRSSSRSPKTGPALPLSVPPKSRREECNLQHAAPVSPRSRCE
eukprot:3683068-Rhodomonas_salina.3